MSKVFTDKELIECAIIAIDQVHGIGCQLRKECNCYEIIVALEERFLNV